MHNQTSSIQYVIVNIWTSAENKVLPGANVGHVSIELDHGFYMSLWPAARSVEDLVPSSSLTKFERFKRSIGSYFEIRLPQFIERYFHDSVAEALSEGERREINRVSECQPGETAVLFDFKTGIPERVDRDPTHIADHQILLAVKLIPANVRLAFYTLNSGKILAEFRDIKKQTTGWTLIGSNRLSLKPSTKENCASLAFKLLEAGGFCSLLDPTSVSIGKTITSLVVKPDDLAPLVVEAKIKDEEKNKKNGGPSQLPPELEPESDFTQLKVIFGLEKPVQDDATSKFSRLGAFFNKF